MTTNHADKRYQNLLIRLTDGYEHLRYPTSPEEEGAKVAVLKLIKVISTTMDDGVRSPYVTPELLDRMRKAGM
jgi:peptidoglycan/xylan/chitin deacetylase (PgdA/CDA1 family)